MGIWSGRYIDWGFVWSRSLHLAALSNEFIRFRLQQRAGSCSIVSLSLPRPISPERRLSGSTAKELSGSSCFGSGELRLALDLPVHRASACACSGSCVLRLACTHRSRVSGASQSILMSTPPPPSVSEEQHNLITGLLGMYRNADADQGPILKLCNQLLKVFRSIGWTTRQQIPTDQAGC